MSNNIKEQSSETLELTLITEESQEEVKDVSTELEKLPLHLIQCSGLLSDIDRSRPNIKCFYMSGGAVFIGVVLLEAADSFLVSLPAKLVMDDNGDMRAEPISSETISRIFKTNISRLTEVLPKSRVSYYNYLLEHGTKYLPDYLSKKMMDSIRGFVIEYQEDAIESVSGAKDIPGTSEFAFRVIHNNNTSIH